MEKENSEKNFLMIFHLQINLKESFVYTSKLFFQTATKKKKKKKMRKFFISLNLGKVCQL